jgi:DNA invertase Pin-like site-specific DNA recombinase
VGRFLLTQMDAVAGLEAGLTSERTKAALAAARARGVKLGGDRGYRSPTPPDWKAGARRSADLHAQAADHSVHKLAAVIEAIRADGATSP